MFKLPFSHWYGGVGAGSVGFDIGGQYSPILTMLHLLFKRRMKQLHDGFL
jgi:hypothetical protein